MGSRWDLRPPPTKFTTDANLKNVYRFSTITNILKYKKKQYKIQRFFYQKYKGFSKKNTPKTHPKTNFSAPAAPKNLGGAPAARPQFPPFRRLRRRKGGCACGAPPFPSFFLGGAPAARHLLHFSLWASLKRTKVHFWCGHMYLVMYTF